MKFFAGTIRSICAVVLIVPPIAYAFASGEPDSSAAVRCVSESLRDRMRTHSRTEKTEDYRDQLIKAMVCLLNASKQTKEKDGWTKLDLRLPRHSGPRPRPSVWDTGPLAAAVRQNADVVSISGTVRILSDFRGVCTWTYLLVVAVDGHRGSFDCVNDQDGTLKHVPDEYRKQWLDSNVLSCIEDVVDSIMHLPE